MMRIFRLIVAVLLAVGLVVLPVSATVTMAHPAKAEMGMGAAGHDCPCCNAVEKCPDEKCAFNCQNAPAISAESPPLLQPLPEAFVDANSAALLPFSRRPDPPPPRS
jgi:hypothetical protein